MSGQLIRSGECRKFSPNIFHKTKCTNCFRQKEEHTAEALESNRATRKVAKCGYLFVAPGWDFTIPVNRTKRWQRRWFVLYDDGELSYSLDEHPETVPQASIDMNKVLEVTNAEEITGNAFSLAITAQDAVHFVKGTCREEARFWNDVLSVFPRSKGRHKRNATFPGTQSIVKSPHIIQTPPVRGSKVGGEGVRNQYNARLSNPVWEGDDVFPTRDTTPTSPSETTPPQPNNTDTRKVYMGSPPTRDKMDEKSRTRRVANREKRGLKTGRSFSEDITKMVPHWTPDSSRDYPDVSHRLLLEDFGDYKLKDITESIVRTRSRTSCLEPTRDGDISSHKQVRGDPDGCGLDVSALRYSPSDLRVDLPGEDTLYTCKGWLLKQGAEKEWTKHFFILRGHALLYYRDSKGDDQNIMDGVIDLSNVSNIVETQAQRNFSFQLSTWDGKQIVLSAMSAGLRSSWVSAIRKAAGLQEPPTSDLSSPIQEHEVLVTSTPMTPRSLLFSSDDEYRTASESGRRESGEWGEALPPSPPLNRTPMSKVKERARGMSKLRVYSNKRSRSSPPTSRRSTLDSISSQDVIAACVNSEVLMDNKLKDVVDKGTVEVPPYKELNRSNEAVIHAKQLDIIALERQIEDLKKKEEELGKLRAREATDSETRKSRWLEEKFQWERAMEGVECELEQANRRRGEACAELSQSQEVVERLKGDVQRLELRLASAIEENEALYQRLKELDKPNGSFKDRARSMDSLSDLTNIDLDLNFDHLDKDRIIEEYSDLRARFEKAVSEIRALKRELKESQAQVDWLELSVVSARQEAKGMKDEAEASNNLMAARVQDLATKLSASEKQIRSLKQKLAKTETREKRRSLSLKGRESFSVKEIEDKLADLESRVSALDSTTKPALTENKKLDKSSSRLRRKSLDSATGTEPLKLFLRLNSLEAKVAKAQESANDNKQIELKLFNGEVEEVDGSHKTEMINEVKKMENLLRAKLVVLAKKKESLIKAGQWTNEAKLNLLAEKLAYESVLIGRLHEAVVESRNLDLTDAERLMDNLDSKLSGGKPNIETSLDYLVKSLAKHLTQQGVKRINRKAKDRRKPDPAVGEILKKKACLDTKVEAYIETVVSKLADVFAKETLADDFGGERSKEHLRAVRSLAQEAVNKELIQAEISQVLTQCSETYRMYMEKESQTRFMGIVKDRANLELWVSMADENLNVQLDSAISKLQDEYQKRLEILKKEDCMLSCPKEKEEEMARALLGEFVDIVAHKCLLDARVSVLCNGDYTEVDAEQGGFEENSLLSEIQFLYVKFSRELSQDSKEEDKLKEAVERLAQETLCLGRAMAPQETASWSEKGESTGDSWLENLCRKCESIKEKVLCLQRVAQEEKDCQTCNHLQDQIQRHEMDHSSLIHELELRKEEEINKLTAEFEEQKVKLIQQCKEEENLMRERSRKLERRLETLDTEYTQQMENLKAVYSNTFSSSNSDLECDESVRQKYQTEIQSIKAACEKTLLVMNNSYQRQIAELREKHEHQIKALQEEKEQALAEETKATLSALDAMRKAHEAEVQKEVAKIKKDYASKLQSSQDIDAIHKQHQVEMEEIKREILSLSEKYSNKCVESASLEDKLRLTTQQLAHAHQHITQLDSRNRQLRAHIVSEANNDSVSRLHEMSHGVGLAVGSPPRVVNAIPKKQVALGSNAHPQPRLIVKPVEPPPLPVAEVKRCPDGLSLCGMVSKRRKEFERRLTAPATCLQPSRATLF